MNTSVSRLVLSFVGMILVCSAQAQTSTVPLGAGTVGNPYQIRQLSHLVWMGERIITTGGEYYTLQNDIDASATAGWHFGAGFVPIGGQSFIFDGNGKVIRNLTIYRPTSDGVGLFGGLIGEVKNLGLVDCSITGRDYVGALLGHNESTVSGCYATGSVEGRSFVGGLIGENEGHAGTVSGCYAACSVSGTGNASGGLVGYNNNYGTLSLCYAEGSVSGTYFAGGLVGNNAGTLSLCYAIGSVSGDECVGGLVGIGASVDTVQGCYAVGAVTGNTSVGGLVGNGVSADTSYWDTNTSGQATSAGGIGRSTAQMKQQATFVGWNFTSVWRITENVTYPYFAWQALAWDAGYQDLGGGWRRLSWFGDYIPMGGAGWIWHNKHGFFYVPPSSTPQSIFFYAQDMGWLWTGSTTYPYLYRFSDGAWLWYNGGTGPRWFLNMSTLNWESR